MARAAKAKSNPFYSNPGEFELPEDDGGFTVMEIAGKFHVIDPDGEQTGKYFLSPEKAVEKAQSMVPRSSANMSAPKSKKGKGKGKFRGSTPAQAGSGSSARSAGPRAGCCCFP